MEEDAFGSWPWKRFQARALRMMLNLLSIHESEAIDVLVNKKLVIDVGKIIGRFVLEFDWLIFHFFRSE
ncbi:hypothetical protein PMAYCL1PPCAC_22438, partial [Pristionchus mayeri]